MSLSVASRRRYQTTATSTSQLTSTSTASLAVRKQHSLMEPASHAHGVSRYSAQQRGYLTRGLSVGRSIENIRQKLYAPSPAGRLSRQTSLALDESAARMAGRLTPSQPDLGIRLRDKSLVAWSSTSSLQKTPLVGDGGQKQRLPEEPKEDQTHSEK